MPKHKIKIGKKVAKQVTAILTTNPNGVVAEKDLAKVAEVCARITKQCGGLSHQTLWAASKKPWGAILKKYYTQDPHQAAQKCWQQESYKIIASIMCFIKEEPALPPIRYFHRVVNENEQPVFKPVTVLFSDNSMMQKRIEQACEELDVWQRKYATLVSYSKWFKQTHAKVTEVVVGVRTKLSQVVDPRDVAGEE